MTHIILRLPTVKIRTGLSRSSIYLRMARDEFPKPISLGGRSVGWLEGDIDEWISKKLQQRDCERIEDNSLVDHKSVQR